MTSLPSLAQLQSQPTQPAAPPPLPPGSELPAPPYAPEGFLDQLLAFIYTLAHWAGMLMVALLNYVLVPENPDTLNSLVDPIGYLVLLTVFLIIAEIAKKITWLIVVVGWALITVRIVLEMMGR